MPTFKATLTLTHLTVVLSFFLYATGCSATKKTPAPYGEVEGNNMHTQELLQSDVNRIATISVRNNLVYLQRIKAVLYELNPDSLTQSGLSAEESERLFWQALQQRKPLIADQEEWRGLKAVEVALSDEFKGDWVALYSFGLTDILLNGFNYRTDLYLINGMDSQKLYNSARELEVATQMLRTRASKKRIIPDQNKDARIERAIGAVVATVDLLAVYNTEKYRRIGINYVQGLVGGELLQFVPLDLLVP